jgi:hypothetical protein
MNFLTIRDLGNAAESGYYCIGIEDHPTVPWLRAAPAAVGTRPCTIPNSSEFDYYVTDWR